MKESASHAPSPANKPSDPLREIPTEYRYRYLVEHANESIFVIQDGFLRFHNPRAEELSGYSGEELSTYRFEVFVYPEDRERIVREYYKVLEGSALYNIQFRFQCKSGEVLWVQVNAVPILWENRPAVLGFLSDIHAQKQAENDLQAALTRLGELENILNRGPAIAFLWLAEPGWPVEFVSENVRQLGYEPEEFLSHRLRYADIIHSDDKERVASEIVRFHEGGIDEYTQVYRVVTASGEARWVEDRTQVRKNSDGIITHYQGIVVDVTERIRAEQTLRSAREELERRVAERTAELSRVNEELRREIEQHKQTENQLRLTARIIEASHEAILITDPQARIVYVNDAFCQITGYSRSEVIGQNPSMMKSGRHDRGFYQAMWESLRDNGCWNGEIWDRRKDGEIYPKLLSITAIRNEEDQVSNYVGIFSDITEMKRTEAHLHSLAYFDPLTGLPNRVLFRDRLERAIVEAQRNQRMVALLLLDLDSFKSVNDTMGHYAGDQLLVGIAERLTRCVRESDTVARLGGDEFAVILTEVHDTVSVAFVARRIVAAVVAPLLIEGHEIRISASVGITLCPTDGTDADQLYRNADLSLYRAKARGRNNFQFFSRPMQKAATERALLEFELRAALEREEFVLFYQPIVSFQTGDVVGVEALIRWQHPKRGLVGPSAFIPLAEATGTIVPLGEWVFMTACSQLRIWDDAGLPELHIAVNVSARQMIQEDLVPMVKRALRETGLSPHRLELEITESAAMKDAEETVKLFTDLQDLGITIALDDFGIGYSSLGYLRRFSIKKIKIDRSFIEKVHRKSDSAAIVGAIVALAKSFGFKVTAEGVENYEQLSFLTPYHLDEWQGYYFSEPLPSEELVDFLKRKASVPPLAAT